jgi:hypothetical protein
MSTRRITLLYASVIILSALLLKEISLCIESRLPDLQAIGVAVLPVPSLQSSNFPL